ncbi:MAG: glycosyltransferase family 4 protein [Deltaproteobacteria bacterium]|jgi:phosphatidyl-myo-inositol alpha-mannosyltransferase|nr:glycosyltransferase family 4 protein [Deltaproteobacteria bacterium]
MKIGIVTEYFFPTLGGILENIYHMSKEFLRCGHDLRIITGYKKGFEDFDIEDEISKRIIHIGTTTSTFFNGSCGCVTSGLGLTKKMRKVFEEEKFDIIHLHSPIFPTLPMIANMQANAPLVATFHTCTGTGDHLLYKAFNKLLQSILDRIAGKIAVSNCCALENKLFFDVNFNIIPNGVDVDWWTSNTHKIEKFDDGKINILYIGRPDSRNGLDTLINAFSIVHKEHPNTRLIIVGDGPLKFYFESLVPHNIKDAVHFEGAATDGRRDYMATSHIHCFTPDVASFGITILEGMSAGKAMIASDIEAFKDLITHEESALLVEPRNIDQHVHALDRLIRDEDLRISLGATAARRVDHYDWKRIAKLHLEYYEKIIEETQ